MANTVAYNLPRSFPNPAAKYGNRSHGTTKVDYRSEKSSAPWLLVHDPPEECRSNWPSIRYHYFRNLSGDTIIKKRDVRFDKVFDRDLPKHSGRYFGCSHSWVSCTAPPSTYSSKPCHRLFDYFGSFRPDALAYLIPHIDIDPLDYLVDPGFPSTYGLERLAISSSHPFETDDCRLMAIRGRSRSLATCKPGAGGLSLLEQLDIWTMLQMGTYKNCGYQDIIYSNEDQCFYAIRGEFPSPYWIESWDVLNIDCPKGYLIQANSNSIPDQYCRHSNPNYKGVGGVDEQYLLQSSTRFMDFMTVKRYLVESSGDIYLVSRFLPRRFSSSGGAIQSYETRADEKERLGKENKLKITYVQKLDKRAQEWKNVGSLGDRAFFVGANHSFSVDATHFPMVMKRNSIYFMDENFKDGHVVGVYNLKTGIEEEIFSNRNNPTAAPPVWIQTLPHNLL